MKILPLKNDDFGATRTAAENAKFEAAEEKRRNKEVAKLKQTLKKSFKAWGYELELIFKDFDEDGNGMMDREELCKGLRTLGADFRFVRNPVSCFGMILGLFWAGCGLNSGWF